MKGTYRYLLRNHRNLNCTRESGCLSTSVGRKDSEYAKNFMINYRALFINFPLSMQI